MKKELLLIVLLSLALNLQAGVRLPDGSIANEGDSIDKLYAAWGQPDMRVYLEKTCGRVIDKRKTYCSYSRSIWKRNGTYEMIQHYGNMIIKTRTTRSERKLEAAF